VAISKGNELKKQIKEHTVIIFLEFVGQQVKNLRFLESELLIDIDQIIRHKWR
jgi:hypothetical protein